MELVLITLLYVQNDVTSKMAGPISGYFGGIFYSVTSYPLNYRRNWFLRQIAGHQPLTWKSLILFIEPGRGKVNVDQWVHETCLCCQCAKAQGATLENKLQLSRLAGGGYVMSETSLLTQQFSSDFTKEPAFSSGRHLCNVYWVFLWGTWELCEVKGNYCSIFPELSAAQGHGNTLSKWCSWCLIFRADMTNLESGHSSHRHGEDEGPGQQAGRQWQ